MDPVNPDLKLAMTGLLERQPAYRLARRYYEGAHDLTYIGPEYRDTFAKSLKGMRYNRCATIVDVHADKLQITGFIPEGTVDAAAIDLNKVAMEIWRRNRMDRRAGEVHLEAFSLGDGYCIVWPNDINQAVIYPQLGDRCWVRYGDDGLAIDLALKLWRLADKRWRANLYYRDRVEKYVTGSNEDGIPAEASTWSIFEEEDSSWPLAYPWGEGMPVFHFGNRARTGQLGVSEIHDLIPLQDAINKSLCAQIVAEEFSSFPQRYVIGMAMTTNDAGDIISPFKNGAGELWAMGPGDSDSGPASFGQFQIGDITQFTQAQDGIDKKISNVSRVPAHWLGLNSTFTSGEQLKTAEAPFTAKIEDRQIAFGNVWEDVMGFCLRVESGAAPETLQLSTQWRSAAPRSDMDFWQIATLKLNAGVAEEEIWREAGYDEDKIAEWLKAKQEREAQAAQMGAALRMAMNDQAPPEGDSGAAAGSAA